MCIYIHLIYIFAECKCIYIYNMYIYIYIQKICVCMRIMQYIYIYIYVCIMYIHIYVYIYTILTYVYMYNVYVYTYIIYIYMYAHIIYIPICCAQLEQYFPHFLLSQHLDPSAPSHSTRSWSRPLPLPMVKTTCIRERKACNTPDIFEDNRRITFCATKTKIMRYLEDPKKGKSLSKTVEKN